MVDNWYVNRMLEALGHGCVCTITCFKGVVLIQEGFIFLDRDIKANANVVDNWWLTLHHLSVSMATNRLDLTQNVLYITTTCVSIATRTCLMTSLGV